MRMCQHQLWRCFSVRRRRRDNTRWQHVLAICSLLLWLEHVALVAMIDMMMVMVMVVLVLVVLVGQNRAGRCPDCVHFVLVVCERTRVRMLMQVRTASVSVVRKIFSLLREVALGTDGVDIAR
jgi:hypothetical protein